MDENDLTSRLVEKLQEISDMDSYIEKVVLDERAAVEAAKEVSETTGMDVSPEMLNQALERVKKERHRFETPKTLVYRLARTYSLRSAIWNRVKRPLFVLALLGVGSFAGLKAGKEISLKSKERHAEQEVVAVYSGYNTISERMEIALNSPLANDLTRQEREEFNSNIQATRDNLSKVDEFLSEYAPEGDSRKVVTRQNMEFVLQQTNTTLSHLTAARTSLDGAGEYVKRAQRIIEARTTLETQISDLSGPNSLIEQAREAYRSGMRAVENRDARAAVDNASLLRGIRTTISDIERIKIGIERDYANIEKIVREDSVRNAIRAVYQISAQNAESGNISSLRENAGEISYAARILPLDLRVRITGGTWMCPSEYETSDGGCRSTPEDAKTWYLNTGAFDGKGKFIPLKIFSTRDNTIKEVDVWGERVEKSQYDAVRQDKVSDGVIDDDSFGRKKPGYLSIERDSKYPNKGQINRIWRQR